MHHLACFAGSVINGASLVQLPATVDSVLTLQNTANYTYSGNLKILRAYSRIDNGTEVRIDTPNLRLIGPPQIFPFETTTLPTNLPPVNKYDESALPWMGLDPLGVLVSRAGAGALVEQTLFWLSDQIQSTTPGPCRGVRASATITATTTGWTPGALTFQQALPTGRYRIIGMAAFGTNLFAARLVFPGQTFRPGILAQDAAGEYDHEWFRRGNFGVFGEFDSIAPPTLEVISAGANAAQTVFLDLVPLGPVRGVA